MNGVDLSDSRLEELTTQAIADMKEEREAKSDAVADRGIDLIKVTSLSTYSIAIPTCIEYKEDDAYGL